MATDDSGGQSRATAFERPEGQPPLTPDDQGGWLLELAPPQGGRFGIEYERVGGIVRIRGAAVLRHPRGDVRQPVTIVLRAEDANDLGPGPMGKMGALG